jgi:prevent-host-death family protein
MESIGAFDAKTRLSELLARAAGGESFVITKHGRPVARLVPEGGTDPSRASVAAERLRRFRGTLGKMSMEDLRAARHEGHRF